MKQLWTWLCLPLPLSCIQAPEIVMVDRATALEQQAAGSFTELEQDLAQRAITPRPVAMTPDQLEALGIKPRPLVDQAGRTEADRVDALLRQRCIGEGKDGFLVDTHDDCVGASDRVVALELIDRVNRARVQLFRWLHAEQPQTPMEALRRAWREHHTLGVVCRAWIQGEDGSWGPKKC